MNEITIETATPPRSRTGRGPKEKSALRLGIESLQPGQVLRWRPAPGNKVAQPSCVAWLVKHDHPGRRFTVRKEHGGFDIYRTA